MVIQSAVRRPDGTWSKPTTLSQTSGLVESPQIAVDAAGEAVVAWDVFFDEGDWIVQSATRTPNGAWSAPTSLTPRGKESNGSSLAMNDAGEAVLVWGTSFGRFLSREVVETASRPPGGSWSAPVKLAEAHKHQVLLPEIAIGPTGEAIAFWERLGLGLADYAIVESASRPAGGSRSAPTPVSANHGVSEDPAIAIGPHGEAVAVWERRERRSVLIQSASRLPGGVWSTPVDIFRAHVFELPHPTIAIDAAGDAVAVWQNEQQAIQGASRSPLGTWSTAATLYREIPNQTLFPEIAITPGGETVAVWKTRTGIWSSFGSFGASAGRLP